MRGVIQQTLKEPLEYRASTPMRGARSQLAQRDDTPQQPVFQSFLNQLGQLSGLGFPTASKAIETLVKLGIAREVSGARRNRLFAYDAYLAILREGTEPL
jgi:Fic family protein